MFALGVQDESCNFLLNINIWNVVGEGVALDLVYLQMTKTPFNF